jgi:hypothetical protein
MNWTEDQLAAYMAKRQAVPQLARDDPPDPGPESQLHSRCLKYCEEHGLPCLSFRQSVKAKGFLAPGWPDLIVFRPKTVTLVELKAAGGRLSQEQKRLRLMLHFLGHEVHVCRSFSSFVKILHRETANELSAM